MNCDDFDDWDNRTPDEKLDALRNLINDQLAEQGYDPVDVGEGELPDEWAETDEDGHRVTFDKESLEEGDLRDLVDTANHEAEHARQFQDGDWPDWGNDEDPIAEDLAWAEGFVGMLEFEEQCQPDPESGVGGDDYGVEFDLDNIGAGWEP